MGQLRRDPDTGAYYNAMIALAGSEQWYYKRRLVPFGEFFPVPAQVREWLRLMNLPYSDFEPGADDQRPLAAAGENLAPTICYEDAYASEQLHLARQSTLLVNVTNGVWCGDSTAPHQHLDISRMRSLETGRPMLRSTNDGVTALIDIQRLDLRCISREGGTLLIGATATLAEPGSRTPQEEAEVGRLLDRVGHVGRLKAAGTVCAMRPFKRPRRAAGNTISRPLRCFCMPLHSTSASCPPCLNWSA